MHKSPPSSQACMFSAKRLILVIFFLIFNNLARHRHTTPGPVEHFQISRDYKEAQEIILVTFLVLKVQCKENFVLFLSIKI